MVLIIRSDWISRVPPYFSCTFYTTISITGVSPSSLCLPMHFIYDSFKLCTSGSSNFARHYSQNRCYFLFLCLLRYFNSTGIASILDTFSPRMWVFPFGYLRNVAYLQLHEAFRRSSRPSSPSSASASTVRPLFLNLFL